MNIPKEFSHFVACFYQGSRNEVSSYGEWLRTRVDMLTDREKPIVKRFLDDVLKQDLSVESLQEIWQNGSPDYWIEDKGIRTFFADLRDTLFQTSK